ncbi:MarR family winged helix-turn-helix transcriptional regulator [Fervidobacterium sp.]
MQDILGTHSVLGILNSIQRIVYKFVHERTLKEFNVHPGQIPILFLLKNNSGLSQKEIAKRIGVEQGTIAIMLRRMEKNKLIERVSDEKDRRITRVYLTKSAFELLETLSGIVKEAENLILESLSDEECKELKKLLEKIQMSLKEKLVDNYSKEA